MQRDSKNCQITGHEMYKITHICTYKQCQQGSRFTCEECIKNQIHIHDTHDQFMRLEDFHIYLNTKVKAKIKQQEREAQRLPQFIQDINQIIQQLKNIVEQQVNYQTNLKEILNSYKKIANKTLLKLKNQQLNYFINIEDYNLDYFQTQNELQNIRAQLQDLCQECFDANYQTYNLLKKQQMDSPSISQNEQFLGFISNENFLTLNRLKSNQTIMNKIIRCKIQIAKFSLNSQFIFTSDIQCCFKQMSTKNNFKQISSNFAFDAINDFIQIDSNELALSSSDLTIYDYIKRRMRLIIKYKRYISCLEYDKINNIIVAQYEDQRIRFYDKNNGQLVLQSYMKEQIYQIQFINQSQILLASDRQFLSFWDIDYEYEMFTLIKKFHQNVQYFQSVYQDQRIIICNRNKLIVIDDNLNIIYEISIRGYDLDTYYKFEQLQSMNYILILANEGELVIMKNTNQL